MADYLVTDTELTQTAGAIRGKTGDSSPIEWESGTGFKSAVENISGGGAVTSVNGQTGDVTLDADDVGAIGAPSSPSTGNVLKYNGSAWVAGDAPAELYWCSYGTTTTSAIATAYGNDGLPMCDYGGRVYALCKVENSGTKHTFACVDGNTVYYVVCNNDTWSNSSTALAPAVTEVTISTAGSITQALDAGKLYHFTGAVSSLTLTLNAASGQPAQYHFDFNSGSTPATITVTGVTWPDGSFTPEASKHYEVDILNGYGVVMAW